MISIHNRIDRRNGKNRNMQLTSIKSGNRCCNSTNVKAAKSATCISLRIMECKYTKITQDSRARAGISKHEIFISVRSCRHLWSPFTRVNSHTKVFKQTFLRRKTKSRFYYLLQKSRIEYHEKNHQNWITYKNLSLTLFVCLYLTIFEYDNLIFAK